MEIIRTAAELAACIRLTRHTGQKIGFVPTMGALHEGHKSLVERSKNICDVTVVSIFVNPTQFAPSEDLEKYPRPIEADIQLLESVGTDILYLPSVEEIYPTGCSTFVNVEGITELFEGQIRPTHFRGVATVVTILFNMVQPDTAFFGQKDLQQCAVIKKMVGDLYVPVEIEICPTVREADGLAMSSRNRYLSEGERAEALTLIKTLRSVESDIRAGLSVADAKLKGSKYFDSLRKKGVLEYLEIVSVETFRPLESFNGDEKVAVIIAAKLGTTRLIDNLLLD
ncbi:MAG: pantoate--beta-alanine ligase [bacterium]